VRQLAWFRTVPKQKNSKAVTSEEKSLTRAEKIEANGGKPLMPDIGEAEYVLRYWFDLGAIETGGMSAAPLSAKEIEAWQSCTGIELTSWEFSIIQMLSRQYIAQLLDSERPECPPPYGDPVNDFDREQVGRKIGNAFKAFTQAKK